MFVVIVGMSVLTYLGVIKFIVETIGRALSFCIGTSPPEGINAVGNIFLHVVKSYILSFRSLHNNVYKLSLNL